MPGYIKRHPVAWVATHRHNTSGGNEAYRFTYLFKYTFQLPAGAKTITLPQDERIRVFAVTVANNENDTVQPAGDLYDNLSPVNGF